LLRRFSPTLVSFSGSLLKSESVFVLERPDRSLLLVDAGLDSFATHLFHGFAALGDEALTRLSLIVFTHRHPDHISGLPALLSALGGRSIPLVAHEHTAEHFSEFLPEPSRNTIHISRTVKHDEYVDATLKLRAIHTPGHTFGHLCLLLEEERILLAGDLFMRLFGLLHPVFKKYHDDFSLWRQTLSTVLDYDWDYAIPTHRKPVKLPRKRVERFIQRMTRHK